MRRWSIAGALVATLVLAGCASAEEPRGPEGPNGYAQAADLGDGYYLWWDRSPESGLTDVIATGPEDNIVGSCLGSAGDLCFVGPQDGRVSLVIADPGAATGVIHFYGQDVELAAGSGPGEDDPAVFGARLPQEKPDESAGWQIELFDGAGEVVFTS